MLERVLRKGEFLMKSIGAGIVIGLGGMCFVSIENNVIGSFLFSIGLLAVLIFQFDLYTGWVCKLENYKHPMMLIITLMGNYIGASVIGYLRWSPILVSKAADICFNKLNKDSVEWFIMSIFCGAFIAIAVYGWDHLLDSRSYWIVIMAVMGFILTGSEHVVANIYYFSAAKMLIDSSIAFKLILCAFGNMIGGLAVGGMITLSKQE